MNEISREAFQNLLSPVSGFIQGKPLDPDLQAALNQAFPPGSALLNEIKQACDAAIAAGWMCKYEDSGIKFGRVIKPQAQTADCSVDVVQMENVVGPHHRHPQGEIDLIMPIDAQAEFDGHGEGWLVYAADSAHNPTVTGGAARVLYLLPGGAIEFTGQ